MDWKGYKVMARHMGLTGNVPGIEKRSRISERKAQTRHDTTSAAAMDGLLKRMTQHMLGNFKGQ
jgi:hypothetical protein